jgi:hypothetical protein
MDRFDADRSLLNFAKPAVVVPKPGTNARQPGAVSSDQACDVREGWRKVRRTGAIGYGGC